MQSLISIISYTVHSLMLSCRRLHAICETPLYKSIELTITLVHICGPDGNDEGIQVSPRTLLECITSSPRCAELAALIPTVYLGALHGPDLCGFHGIEDWVFDSAGSREQLHRIDEVLLHMAPSRLRITSQLDWNPWVWAHILDRLNVSRLEYFDPECDASGPGPVDQPPFIHNVLSQCAPSIKHLYFPETGCPHPDVTPPPAMPELRQIAVGLLIDKDAMAYILRVVKEAPRLSSLQLPRASLEDNVAHLTALLSPNLPDTLVSLWVANLIRYEVEIPWDMLPYTLDLTCLVHLQTLTVSNISGRWSINFLPPNLHHLRIRSFNDDHLEDGALQSLRERIEDPQWQPKLIGLVIPAVHYARVPTSVSCHSLLLKAAEQRGVCVEQRDEDWWREEEEATKGW